MRLASVVTFAAVMGGALAPGLASAQSLRCDGRLVSVGDTAYTLRERCGEPTFTASYPILEGSRSRISATGETSQRLVKEEAQWWTYAGDPGKFVRTVQVRRGEVRAVHVLSTIRGSARDCKTKSDFRQGVRAGGVYVTCGAPVDRARWVEHREKRKDDESVTRAVVRQRWTYDPGPGKLLRVLQFENGKLVSIGTTERSPR